MVLGRFFDEENIVKKEPQTPVEPPVTEPIIEPPTAPVEKPKRIRKKKEEAVVVQEVVEPITDKQEKYQQVINQVEVEQKIEFPDSEKDLQQMLDKVYQPPKMPIYHVSRDMGTGQVKVEARKNEATTTQQPKPNKQDIQLTISPPKKQVAKTLLDKTEQEIIRIGLEIEIGLALIRMESDGKVQSLYEAKLTALKNDLDYQQKRRLILERMLQGE